LQKPWLFLSFRKLVFFGFDHRFGHQAHQTEKCGTEKWQILSFCPTFFCLMAETMINAVFFQFRERASFRLNDGWSMLGHGIPPTLRLPGQSGRPTCNHFKQRTDGNDDRHLPN